MSDNVIELDDYRNEGNGAREVLIDHMADYECSEYELAQIGNFIDALLARLWTAGYKIVPVEEGDTPVAPL